MGDAPFRYGTWLIVGVAIGVTLLPYVPGHYSVPRLSTLIVIWAAIVAWRGRPIIAVAPALTLMAWPGVATGQAYPLCCTYGTTWIEPVVLIAAVMMVAIVLKPDQASNAHHIADALALILAAAIASQSWIVLPEGALSIEAVGWLMAAALLGLGLGSGVRPWLLAVMPMVVFVGIIREVGPHDVLLLTIALAASTTGPMARALDSRRAQASVSTTS